jgi:PAS domain S-box-containing protein
MSEGVFTVDEDGLVRFVNAAAEDILGWSGTDLIGRSASWTIGRRLSGRRGRPRRSRIDRARAARAVVRVHDDVFMRRDGVELPVAYTVTPLAGEDGGSVVVFSDASERSVEGARLHGERAHAAIVARVRQALAQDDFVLHAQPVYDLRTMEVHSHELLIRMREPGGHLRAPAQFLPAAERSGLIVEIDEWVIQQGALLAARGHDVSLNVSAASVGTPGFIETVATMFEEAGADPRRVIMELTETAVVRDERPAREFIDAMRALGCEFALDDFGTGYGGFTYIKHLAIDYLKIDREFVRDLDRDTSSRHVVEVIVSLAGRFGLRTVAEGVESRACLEVLSDLGVDYAQGYRLRRPAPLGRAFAEGGG